MKSLIKKLFPRPKLLLIDDIEPDSELRQRFVEMNKVLYHKLGQRFFTGTSILDLGSCHGHFPLHYVRLGAAHVTAVEVRKMYEDFFINKLCIRFWKETAYIKWVRSDMRSYKPGRKFDIVSCLGLIYHVQNGFDYFEKILEATTPHFVLFDSSLWPKSHIGIETGRCSTNCAKPLEFVPKPDSVQIEYWFQTRGYKTELLIENFNFPGNHLRGFWLCTKLP